MVLDQDLFYSATNTTVPTLRNTTRQVVITYTAGVLRVTLAGTEVLNQAVTLPPFALVGWTASTGAITDRHMISNVTFG